MAVTVCDFLSKVGDILTAEVTPDQLVTYQWFADKTEIPDADGATLAVTEDMVGKKLSVKVTSLTGEVATSDATAAVEKDLPELVNVLQESSNQIKLKFDGDASVIGAEDIEVARDEDGLVNSVEKVEPYTEFDSTTLLATVSSPFIDDTVYDVTVGAVTTSFTASVGEVAAIIIETYEAEVNKPTKVEYKLLDEKGVDVTSTVNRKETVLADITGTYKAAKTSDPTDISVTMGAVDDECEVTISYNKGTGSEEGISKTQKITCVGPTASKGTIKYAKTDDVNINSKCAKFYLDGVGTAGKVTVALNEDTSATGAPVYFSAFDDNGAAIDYEQYEVESANEAIVAATVRSDATSGKFTVIDLAGNEVGTTQVKVIATNNTVSKEYYMNVTVKKIEDMVKVTLSDSRSRKLSNAYDEDYKDSITASIVDENGNDANCETIEWKLLNAENYKVASDIPTQYQGKFSFVSVAGPKAVVKAWGAKAGTYTVQATADIADKKVAQTLKVTVSELPTKAWVGEEGVALKYGIELGSSIGNIGAKNEIKLFANVNGLFAGYVRQASIEAAVATSAAVALSDKWLDAMADSYGDDVKYSIDGGETKITSTALEEAAAGVEADHTTLFTEVAVYDGDETEAVGRYSLKRYEYNTLEFAAETFDEKTAGGYFLVAPGEAIGGGEITVGGTDEEPISDGEAWFGATQANTNTTIVDGSLAWTLKYGNKKKATGQLFGFLENLTADTIDLYSDGITAYSDRLTYGADLAFLTYIANDSTYDYDIARPGRYDVVMTYVNAKTLKTTTEENQFAVTDTVKAYVPKVTLNTKTTDNYSVTAFQDILTLNVDLNNNDGLAESLTGEGLIQNWVAFGKNDDNLNGYIETDEQHQIDSDNNYAKYAVVEEGVTSDNIPVLFFVPVGANIKED